ncbi:sensor histidine kinase [Ktedonobacter robiniae]|nr:sensor histidine kinase [Ktedonobacter robiniae]
MQQRNIVVSQKHPLRWLLLVWVGVVYAQSVLMYLSAMQDSMGVMGKNGAAGLYSVLGDLVFVSCGLLLHGALHWIALYGHLKQRYLWVYFLVQALLVESMLVVTGAQFAISTLFLALTLEAVSLLKWTRPTIIISGSYLVLYTLATLPQQGLFTTNFQNSLVKSANFLVILMFIVACLLLYRQRAQAHQRDQELLSEVEQAHHELEHTHAQLEEAHIQLEDYAAQVQDLTLITERQRLARELHDTLSQGLVAITMQLETTNGLLAREQVRQARDIVQQAMARARATLTEARNVIDDLRAETPGSLDLQEAIQQEVKRFTEYTSIPCECDIEALTMAPPASYEHIQRMISEGLSNIVRHAQAHNVFLSAVCERQQLIIMLRDDGVGFAPAQAQQLPGHFGLLGLRERARLIGARFEVCSDPGKGTTLRFFCLLSLEQHPQEQRETVWEEVRHE